MDAPRTRRRLVAGLLAVATVLPVLALTTPTTAGAEPEARTYVVRTGDTLSEIAARHGTTTARVVAVNDIDDPNDIRTGRRLVIPANASGGATGAQVHVVQDGESFWSIAHEHGISIAALAGASGRSATSVLHTGDRLTIPSGHSDTGVPARLIRSGRIGMRPTFVTWATRNGIDPALLQAVCYLESGWQHHVVSSTGAIGVCQLMPDSVDFAERLIGKDLDPRDPTDNIRMGARTLRWLLAQTDGNTRQALAAYYQGLTALRRSGPYPETVQYVNAVQALAERF